MKIEIENRINEIIADNPYNAKNVYLSKKIRNGKLFEDETVICFLVDKKINHEELTDDQIIPETVSIGGKTYKTDVREVENYKFLACYNAGDTNITKLQGSNGLLTPLKGGQEIIQFPTGGDWVTTTTVGTLGLLAVDEIDNLVVGVTNTHVACDNLFLSSDRTPAEELPKPYNTVEPITWVNGVDYEPSALSYDNTSLVQTCLHIKRHSPFKKNQLNYVDAALLIMNPNMVDNTSYQLHQPNGEPDHIPHFPFATTAEIDNILATNPTLYSTGRTTGPKGWGPAADCQLRVTALVATVGVGFSDDPADGLVQFGDLIEFAYQDISAEPIKGGDSGSVLIADINGVRKVIGLVFAGSFFYGLACRIDRVASEMKLKHWDSSYTYNDTVPTPVIKVIQHSAPESSEVFVIESGTGSVYSQAGITMTTTHDNLDIE